MGDHLWQRGTIYGFHTWSDGTTHGKKNRIDGPGGRFWGIVGGMTVHDLKLFKPSCFNARSELALRIFCS